MVSHTLVRPGSPPTLSPVACLLPLCNGFILVLHVGMQQSSKFSGSEQSKLPHGCDTDLPLPAKEGTEGCEMVKSAFL